MTANNIREITFVIILTTMRNCLNELNKCIMTNG